MRGEDAKQKFDWPAPALVGISEVAEKDGNHAEMSYALDVKTGDDGMFIIRITDFQFDSFNHQPITPEFERALQPAVDAVASLPSFIVDQEGHLIDITSIDALIDETGKLLDSTGDGNTGSEAAEALKDPAMKQMLNAAISEYWVGWVGAWVDYGLDPGESAEEQFSEVLVPNQPAVTGTRTYQHLGETPDKPDHIHLKIDSHIGDPTMVDAIGGLISGIDKTGKAKEEINSQKMPNITVDGGFEVKINPTTLRPAWSRRYKNIEIKGLTEEESGTRTESHEYTFHWKTE
ncbi:MAG: hypothetical protein CMO55_14520 [Verrucomicrobiales bacterium]|nr:hypothetical protein [Verrucomicrobiales bacterium]